RRLRCRLFCRTGARAPPSDREVSRGRRPPRRGLGRASHRCTSAARCGQARRATKVRRERFGLVPPHSSASFFATTFGTTFATALASFFATTFATALASTFASTLASLPTGSAPRAPTSSVISLFVALSRGVLRRGAPRIRRTLLSRSALEPRGVAQRRRFVHTPPGTRLSSHSRSHRQLRCPSAADGHIQYAIGVSANATPCAPSSLARAPPGDGGPPQRTFAARDGAWRSVSHR